MRLLGELAAKAGATDLPLDMISRYRYLRVRSGRIFCIPHVLNPHPGRPRGEEAVWQVE